jgi:hypothetical protein
MGWDRSDSPTSKAETPTPANRLRTRHKYMGRVSYFLIAGYWD